jgi:hypothetical protein
MPRAVRSTTRRVAVEGKRDAFGVVSATELVVVWRWQLSRTLRLSMFATLLP